MKVLEDIEWIKSHHQSLTPFGKGKPAFVDLEKMFYGKTGSLYIHIPYCLGTCKFCICMKKYGKPNSKYVDALLKELSRFEYYKAKTLHFGGGTPTLLSAEEFKRVLEFILKRFGKPEEITVETTINEFNKKKAEYLSSFGVNRVSFGIQTFNESERYLLGRRSGLKKIIEKIKLAKDYFKIVSIDLLYDLPYENFLLNDVKKAVELGINGISIYPLDYNKAMGVYPHPDIKKNEEDFIEAYNFLNENGYSYLAVNHISDGSDKSLYLSAAKDLEEPLLGVGCGAGGYIENISFMHLPFPSLYNRGILQRVKMKTPEKILSVEKFISQAFNGYITFDDFSIEDFQKSINFALNEGWAELDGKKFLLIPKGLFWVNTLVYIMAKEFFNI